MALKRTEKDWKLGSTFPAYLSICHEKHVELVHGRWMIGTWGEGEEHLGGKELPDLR